MADRPDDDFPLPPPELLAEMTAPAARPVPAPQPAAKLTFVGGKAWTSTVPLDFPFEHDGRVVSEVTLHRLTAAEMGEVVDRLGTAFTRWDLIAAMADLAVDVLRGLEAGDGDAVMEVGLDFLPRALKG